MRIGNRKVCLKTSKKRNFEKRLLKMSQLVLLLTLFSLKFANETQHTFKRTLQGRHCTGVFKYSTSALSVLVYYIIRKNNLIPETVVL